MNRGYYAGLKRGERRAFLLGPFDTQDDAAAWLEPAHEKAIEIDPFCHFDVPGVFFIETPKPLPAGRLNTEFAPQRGAVLN